MKKVPNLICREALDYTAYLHNHMPEDTDVFDFIQIETCEPFPMLLVSSAIREYRSSIKDHISHSHAALNCNNTYANTMRFFRATGIDKGRSLKEDYGNQNYMPITRLCIDDLQRQSDFYIIQDIIEQKAGEMATVLSRNTNPLKSLLKYTLTEIMRNIPEHSGTNTFWYCMQHWPSKDKVELAFLDEGMGIRKSLLSNPAYSRLVDDDRSALMYAIRPGISSAFAPGGRNLREEEWANSGYGLYMISSLCAELGGDFIIASGDTAMQIRMGTNNSVTYSYQSCFVDGTAIRIVIKPSRINDYKNVAKRILSTGERTAKSNGKSIEYASTSTRKIFDE